MLKNILVGLLVTGSIGACTVRGQARVVEPTVVVRPPVATVEVSTPVYEVEEAPPPPVQETIVVRPGRVWIQGRHERIGNRWVWREGRYEAERRGQQWEAGRWERRGNRHVWVEGRWHAPTATVIVH